MNYHKFQTNETQIDRFCRIQLLASFLDFHREANIRCLVKGVLFPDI